MTETYYVGSYWFARKETAEECARRTEGFFRSLSRLDPLFSCWFEQASSLKKARQLEFQPNAQTFQAFFARKKYKGVRGAHSHGARLL